MALYGGHKCKFQIPLFQIMCPLHKEGFFYNPSVHVNNGCDFDRWS